MCAWVCVCVCLCFRHFTTSCFSKLTSEPLGRKICHHLPSVTNNIFWIMIASIGFYICKYEVMNFLCEQWKQTEILCHFAWMDQLDGDGLSLSDKRHLKEKSTSCLEYEHAKELLCMCCINIPIDSRAAQTLWHVLRGKREVCDVESDECRPPACWLPQTRGPVKGFEALDWVSSCHTRVMLSLPDEPCSYAINSIIAWKCICLICETMTVLLDLWHKARFN